VDAKLKALRDIEEGMEKCSDTYTVVLLTMANPCMQSKRKTKGSKAINKIVNVASVIGEELRICYIDTSMDVNARQKILADGFGFECHCLRCLSGD
jgi:hypothetical protein